MKKYRIVESEEIKVIGLNAEANFTTNGQITGQLARQFMPRLKEILNRKDNFTVSLQKYEYFSFEKFNPHQTFDKWIGVEVEDFDGVPGGLNRLSISKGKYLVIDFKGSVQQFIALWQDVHSIWLKSKGFELDNRPHFEKLPPSYNPMNETNEEEIWIPIK